MVETAQHTPVVRHLDQDDEQRIASVPWKQQTQGAPSVAAICESEALAHSTDGRHKTKLRNVASKWSRSNLMLECGTAVSEAEEVTAIDSHSAFKIEYSQERNRRKAFDTSAVAAATAAAVQQPHQQPQPQQQTQQVQQQNKVMAVSAQQQHTLPGSEDVAASTSPQADSIRCLPVKRTMCKFFEQGRCDRGVQCTFAHSQMRAHLIDWSNARDLKGVEDGYTWTTAEGGVTTNHWVRSPPNSRTYWAKGTLHGPGDVHCRDERLACVGEKRQVNSQSCAEVDSTQADADQGEAQKRPRVCNAAHRIDYTSETADKLEEQLNERREALKRLKIQRGLATDQTNTQEFVPSSMSTVSQASASCEAAQRGLGSAEEVDGQQNPLQV